MTSRLDELYIRTRYASDTLTILVFGETRPSATFVIDGKIIEAPQSLMSAGGVWSISVGVNTEQASIVPDGDWVVQVSFG